MKCSTCVAEGKRSRVYPGESFSTCMSGCTYYDEEGRPHYHDPNVTTTRYRCSEGHEWKDEQRNKCWCEDLKVPESPEEVVPATAPEVDAPPAPILYTPPSTQPRQPHSIFDSMENLLGYPTEQK